MAKTLKIDDVDFTSYMTEAGYTVAYEPVDGGQGGLMLNGEYEEDEIGQKAVVTYTVWPLNETRLSTLLTRLMGSVYHTVQYFDPKTRANRTMTARRSINEVKYRGKGANNTDYWTGLVITLREK